MIGLLSRIFIKNHTDYKNPEVRRSYGFLTGIVGIILNFLLFSGKLFAGIITSSISIIADAINNLSDTGSSVITMVGFKLAGRPADSEHPFGHGRIEYIASLFVSVLILFMGFELEKGSIEKIINPEDISFNVISLVILGLSLLVKLYIFLYNRKIGCLISSSTMKATALDSLSDCISTGAVIAGLIVFLVWGINIDGYVGVLVGLFIFKTGIESIKESITPLLGEKADEELINDIKETAISFENVIGVHDLIIHNYGVGQNMISFHAEVPAEMEFMEAHEMIDIVENEMKKKYGCVTIHMDPVLKDNEQTIMYKKLVNDVISAINENLSIHDFRMTDGNVNKNLIFDVEVPFGIKESDEEIRNRIVEGIKAYDSNLNVVISVDKKIY